MSHGGKLRLFISTTINGANLLLKWGTWSWKFTSKAQRLRRLEKAPLAPPPSGISCISVFKWHVLAECSMQYEICCSYFVRKWWGQKTRRFPTQKKVGDMSHPSPVFAPMTTIHNKSNNWCLRLSWARYLVLDGSSKQKIKRWKRKSQM